jgi:allophanate hydrolase subunit 2
VRELEPTLKQLRTAGVTAAERDITAERVEETVVLDATTYRITSHAFRCVFRIPYGGQTIRYSQNVTERTEGVFPGAIALPPGVR